jgi:hypothetical protein
VEKSAKQTKPQKQRRRRAAHAVVEAEIKGDGNTELPEDSDHDDDDAVQVAIEFLDRDLVEDLSGFQDILSMSLTGSYLHNKPLIKVFPQFTMVNLIYCPNTFTMVKQQYGYLGE